MISKNVNIVSVVDTVGLALGECVCKLYYSITDISLMRRGPSQVGMELWQLNKKRNNDSCSSGCNGSDSYSRNGSGH